ncbi:MAG: heparinase, partial [Bacteroides sp.]
MKNYILLLLLLWTLPSQGQTQKLLQSLATKKDLQASILPIDSWVKYPQYTNRHEWSKLFGKDKKHIITQAEKQLNYSWQAVTATSYLEFERSGNREAMEVPFNANIKAISSLLLGELAEGKGRFIDALVDGVYFTCEMTSWSLAAHQIMQPTHRALPTPINPVIDLVSG